MKKIVYFSLIALCLPIGLMVQGTDDGLYFVPSKDKKEKKETIPEKKELREQVTTNIYTSPGTIVVVQDRKGKTRDVGEYNRRYDARENELVMENDILYIKEKAQPDLEGEQVIGEFDGSQEDYEHAERIIRFRNPRFVISISSPLYWDVVYEPNSWNWNVYTDGMHVYALPTFNNPLWWDWRYNSYGRGWNYSWGWNRLYYGRGYYPGSWGGWYGGYWGGFYGGGYWGHHHRWGSGSSRGWGGGHRDMLYTDRRFPNRSVNRTTNGTRYTSNRYQFSHPSSARISPNRTTSGRVVGTRENSTRTGVSTRTNSSRGDTYTHPSSTCTNMSSGMNRSSSTRTPFSRNEGTYNRGPPSRSSGTYSRGSSSYTPSRSSNSRTYTPSSSNRSSSSSRTYTPSSSSHSSSSSSYSLSSSSSRSSGSSYGGGSSSSSRGSPSDGGGSAKGGSRR